MSIILNPNNMELKIEKRKLVSDITHIFLHSQLSNKKLNIDVEHIVSKIERVYTIDRILDPHIKQPIFIKRHKIRSQLIELAKLNHKLIVCTSTKPALENQS